MPTIDSLARHVAALREAQRLTALVLANNPAFAALQTVDTSAEGTQTNRRSELESDLKCDPIYVAWHHLGQSLCAITPKQTLSSPVDQTIAQQIVLISNPRPAPLELTPTANRQPRVPPTLTTHLQSDSAPPLHQKLRCVLAKTGYETEEVASSNRLEANQAPRLIQTELNSGGSTHEASVAIVTRVNTPDSFRSKKSNTKIGQGHESVRPGLFGFFHR